MFWFRRPTKHQILSRAENMNKDRLWSERSANGCFSYWRLNHRPVKTAANKTLLGTSSLGNTHRHAGNNILEDLQLEGENSKPPLPTMPLRVLADNDSFVACITNGICNWCLGDAGPDHPNSCDPSALCLKCKWTGHMIKDYRSSCRNFHKPHQDKEKLGASE